MNSQDSSYAMTPNLLPCPLCGDSPEFFAAGEKLYNELRQWLATESDQSSQDALQAWRDAVARSKAAEL